MTKKAAKKKPTRSAAGEVLSYARACVAGEILSCKKHAQACARFLRDYEAAQEPGSRFKFDWAPVDRVLLWASLFKHTKGILTGEFIKLHISQVFIIANIYGFYYRATGYRRFQKFYWQVARKNAKSQLLAVILSYPTIKLRTLKLNPFAGPFLKRIGKPATVITRNAFV